MTIKKQNEEEEFVFEFFEEDIGDELEIQDDKKTFSYNDVNFEANLNEEQVKVVNNLSGPMLVIAGAGSGKTRTIVYSVAKLLKNGVHPGEIMLVTFTNKAAREMVNRLEELLGKRPKGIWAGTFHAIANRFLRIYAETIGLNPDYSIMDEADARSLMKLSIKKVNVEKIKARFPSAKIAKRILSYSINCNKTMQEVILWRYEQFDDDKIINKLKEVFKIYKKKKAKDGLLDFDDLLVFWNILLDEKKVAQMIAKRIKYILVDEYQDTNHIQDEIVYKIAKQNKEKNVIVVGDDSQSIYAFRGANYHNILDFPKKYPGCKKYQITFNYRSTPEILNLANDSIKENKKQHLKVMKPTRKSGIKPFKVEVADDKDQAKFIANQVLKLRSEGHELEEMAVLYRASYHSMKIEVELRKKNIPYEVRSGVAFFERAHIKDLLSYVRIISNPYDEISWSRIFSITQGIGQKSGIKIFEVISRMEDPIKEISKPNFFAENLKGERIYSSGKKNLRAQMKKVSKFTVDDEPADAILELIDLIEDYIKSKYEDWEDRINDLRQLSVYAQSYSSIQKFLEVLTLNIGNIGSKTVKFGSKKEEEKPLILSTIHKAKGLEWGVVFIPMLAEDHFPSSRVVGDPDGIEEERRVFYVAVTRSKDLLYLISPAMVQSYRGHLTARPSPFIMELNSKVFKKSTVRFNRKQKDEKKELSGFTSALDLLNKSKD